MTGRVNVTRMAIRPRTAGVPLQRSSSRRSRGTNTELKIKLSRLDKKISELREAIDTGNITHTSFVRLVVERLNRNDRTQQKKYERRTISVGVGPLADRKLDSYMQQASVTKKGYGQQSSNPDGSFARSIDRIRSQYFNDSFSYYNSYRYGIFAKPWYLERFELTIRTRNLQRCHNFDCSTCRSSRLWLALRECCRPMNNPIV